MKEPPVRIMADGQPGQMYDSLTDGGGKIVVSCHRDYQVSTLSPPSATTRPGSKAAELTGVMVAGLCGARHHFPAR